MYLSNSDKQMLEELVFAYSGDFIKDYDSESWIKMLHFLPVLGIRYSQVEWCFMWCPSKKKQPFILLNACVVGVVETSMWKSSREAS